MICQDCLETHLRFTTLYAGWCPFCGAIQTSEDRTLSLGQFLPLIDLEHAAAAARVYGGRATAKYSRRIGG